MAFDGIVTKAICSELSSLAGARIDKIFEPNKNTITIGLYGNHNHYLLNLCIDAQNCRMHLTTHASLNPQVAPNFCMVLRKNLLGLHLKNIFTLDLERLIIMEFEGFDEADDIICKKLIVELMGKHSNIILLDEQQIIIDSLRHIKQNSEEFRDILPHTKYVFPNTEKQNFLAFTQFSEFYDTLCHFLSLQDTTVPTATLISSAFNGISKSFIEAIIWHMNENGIQTCPLCDAKNIQDPSTRTFLETIYQYIFNITSHIGTPYLAFAPFSPEGTQKKDYYLVNTFPSENERYCLNFYIDDFYYQKESGNLLKTERNTLLKYILSILQKYNKRLHNIQEKLKECENMELYRLYGELITSNLYQWDGTKNLSEITVLNYYDNTQIRIPLDTRYSLHANATRYFKKYHKLKNALEIVGKQKQETEQELEYLQSVVYELENASSIEEIYEIFDEISENSLFEQLQNTKQKAAGASAKIKKSKLTTNKNVSFNPIKYTIDGYTVFVGRNNKENDYLTLKYAHKYDIWFHVKDFHGSHTILTLPNSDAIHHIPQDLLAKVAKLAVTHSKAKNSSNVPVDYCQVRYVKKPSGSKPGMVIYTDYKTIYV